MGVVGIEDRTIYKLSDSWVVTIPNDVVKAIQEVQGEKKRYPVKILKLSNGDLVIKVSDLIGGGDYANHRKV